MGCFDSVYFKCPKCGEEIEEQSKADECCQINYEPNEVPFKIAASLTGQHIKCYECKTKFVIKCEGLKEPPTFELELVEI